MAVNIHKNYPYGMLEDSYEPKAGEGLKKGMFAVLDATTNKLVKANDTANEYAMCCLTDQSASFVENGGKVQVVKENASLWTSYYKVGPSYVPHVRLQVSAAGGEEGMLTIYASGPVIGRFVKIEVINGASMMLFDLTRS